MTMDMNRFYEKQNQIASNSGLEFADVERVVVSNGVIIRIVGNFASTWEHFIETDKGPRPYYCEGPESDCPLCKAISTLGLSESKPMQELAVSSKAKERFYFNVLDRSPAGRAFHAQKNKTKILSQNEKGLSIGTMLFTAIANVAAMRRQTGQADSPNAYDIMLTKSGSGFQTKYGAQFTGSVEPLTPEEEAYETLPVEAMAKITPIADRDAAAQYLLSGQRPAQQTQQTQQTQTQTQQRPSIAPGPATQPNRQQSHQSLNPPAQGQNRRLEIKPKTTSQYQDTSPRTGPQPDNIITCPCSSCGVEMTIDMNDERDVECHACKTHFDNPSK